LSSVIDTLGAAVNSIIVNDLKNDTFFAKVILEIDGKHVEVDSRPSDALALAVRTGVPIFADESVLEKAGILLDGETGRPIFDEKDEVEGKHSKVSDEEMKKKMSAFYDFINTLDLDDFDKRKS
jgi:bifunctional DNase/RNase